MIPRSALMGVCWRLPKTTARPLSGTPVAAQGSKSCAAIPPRSAPRHPSPLRDLAFNPVDGQILATASWDGTVRLWSARPPGEYPTLLGHTDIVLRAVYSPDGRYIATA